MIQLAGRSCVQSVIDASPMMAGRATAVIMSARRARKTPSPRSVRKRSRGASSGRAGSTPTSRLYRGPRPLDNPSSIVHIKDCLWRMPDEGRGPGDAPPAPPRHGPAARPEGLPQGPRGRDPPAHGAAPRFPPADGERADRRHRDLAAARLVAPPASPQRRHRDHTAHGPRGPVHVGARPHRGRERARARGPRARRAARGRDRDGPLMTHRQGERALVGDGTRQRGRESIVPLARAISAAGLSADALTVGGFLPLFGTATRRTPVTATTPFTL